MTTRRTTNKELLRAWIKKNGKGSVERLALAANCSSSLIHKMIGKHYDTTPGLDTSLRLAGFMEVELNDLFPVISVERAA